MFHQTKEEFPCQPGKQSLRKHSHARYMWYITRKRHGNWIAHNLWILFPSRIYSKGDFKDWKYLSPWLGYKWSECKCRMRTQLGCLQLIRTSIPHVLRRQAPTESICPVQFHLDQPQQKQIEIAGSEHRLWRPKNCRLREQTDSWAWAVTNLRVIA